MVHAREAMSRGLRTTLLAKGQSGRPWTAVGQRSNDLIVNQGRCWGLPPCYKHCLVAMHPGLWYHRAIAAWISERASCEWVELLHTHVVTQPYCSAASNVCVGGWVGG